MREYFTVWRRQNFAVPYTAMIYFEEDPGPDFSVPNFPSIVNPSEKVWCRVPDKQLLVRFLNKTLSAPPATYTYDGFWANEFGIYHSRDAVPVVDAHFYSTDRPRDPSTGRFVPRP